MIIFSGLEDPKDSIVSVCENGEAFCNSPNKIRCDLFTCSKLNVDTATVTSMLKSRVYMEELNVDNCFLVLNDWVAANPQEKDTEVSLKCTDDDQEFSFGFDVKQIDLVCTLE